MQTNFAIVVCSLQLVSHLDEHESFNRFCSFSFPLLVLSGSTERPSPYQMEWHLTNIKINGLNSTASVDNCNLTPELFKMPRRLLQKTHSRTLERQCSSQSSQRHFSPLLNKYSFHEYSYILWQHRERGLKIAPVCAWTCFQQHTQGHRHFPKFNRLGKKAYK